MVRRSALLRWCLICAGHGGTVAASKGDSLVRLHRGFDKLKRALAGVADQRALRYRGQHPDGYGYSRFCDLYGEWRRGVTATMRQTHAAGEKLFVDFAGDTMPVFDAITGELREAKIFVAVLGASNYTYVEARFSEGLPDWIGAHVNALAFLGGAPKAIVCDNLKAGVTTASRYEPGVNRTYQDLAAHYGTTIMPTRPRKPRDKAKGGGSRWPSRSRSAGSWRGYATSASSRWRS